MNRRNFLGIVAATPFVGLALHAAPFVPESVKPTPKTFQDLCKPGWDNLEIFTPEEIAKHWTYVSIPSFRHNEQSYLIRTWKLKYKMSERHIVDMWHNPQWKKLMQEGVKRDVDKLELTHVYMISFPTCYVIGPYDYNKYYCAYVRGARVK